MRYIIDRLEETLAICETEDRNTITVPRTDLPASTKEGDVLVLQDGIWELDTEATDERRRKIRKKMLDLFE